MDEGSTLDFNDLMDTGDDFPGFEIAKFEPANVSSNPDDGILRTPEHEKDDEDYVARDPQNKNNDKDEINVEQAHSTDKDEKIDLKETERNSVNEQIDGHTDVAVMEAETAEDDSDKTREETSDETRDEIRHETSDETRDETRDGEPEAKRKKMYLKPPKPTLKLWTKKNAEDLEDDTSHHADKDGSDETDSRQNGENEGDNKDKEQESPQQMSFLSFLNLKPGQSKPKEEEDLKKEETLQEEFYSRKRLRTRKKVSYCEDVQPDDDDSYNEEEDEESDGDHQIVGASARSNRRRSRTNSNSPGKSSAMSTYAKALQNLLPGVDLTCLQQSKTSQIANKVQFVPVPSPSSNSSLKGLFECGLCGTFFQTANQFLSHQEAAHAGQPKNGRSGMETFRCEVCGFVLTNRFAYLEHKKMKHGKTGGLSFNCNKCKMSRFPDLAALQRHQQVCGTPFCSTCGATFQAWVDVADHRKKMHSTSVPTRQWLTCMNASCNFKCITQHEMKQHVQVKHMLNELFSCNAPKCSRVFSTREQLTEHKKDVHALEFIVQYQCMECKNCFSSKTLLAEHQYLHTLEKLRKCDLCLRTFGCVTELRKHKDVHTVKGIVRCQACLRWCTDKVELVNHICAQRRQNTGIRLYFCDVCHKDFRSDEKMFAHRKDHKNFFQCALCFLEFSSENEYFDHREVHGKFTCTECCEELEQEEVEMHKKAHKYYIKMEDIDNDGKNEKVMFLCPNLLSAIQV